MSSVSFIVEPEEASPEALESARRAERAIREVYEANSLDQLDFDNEIDCSILGDAAYKVTWDPLERRVRVSAPDVQGLYAWWLGDDPSRVWRVASRYVSTTRRRRAVRLAAALAQERACHRGGLDRIRFSALAGRRPVGGGANPYGFIPSSSTQPPAEPKQFWGISDLAALKEPLRELNHGLSPSSLRSWSYRGTPIAVLENITEAQGHRRAAGSCLGGPGEGEGLPAGPAPGGRRWPARGLCQSGAAHPARPGGGAAQRLRGRPGKPCPASLSRWSWTPC